MTMKRFLLLLVAGTVSAGFAATSYSWKADASGNYDGVFSDVNHWNPSIENGPGSGYPESTDNLDQIAAFPRVAADYTVTLPKGVVTNAATIQLKGQYGNVVTLDGTGTTWVQPQTGVNYNDFWVRLPNFKNGAPADGGTILKTSANAGRGTFKDLKMVVGNNKDGVPGTHIDLYGDYRWEGGVATFFGDAGDPDGRAEIEFHDATVDYGQTLAFGVASVTNVLTFNGGTYGIRGNHAVQPWSGRRSSEAIPGILEINVRNGAVVTNTAQWSFGYKNGNDYSTNTTFRLNVGAGSWFEGQLIATGAGRYEVNVLGKDATLNLVGTTSISTFANDAHARGRILVADGARLTTLGYISLGGRTAAAAVDSSCDLVVSNAYFKLRRKLEMNGGSFTLVDGAVMEEHSGESDAQIAGSSFGNETAFYADDAIITNQATVMKVGITGLTAAKVGPKGLAYVNAWNIKRELPQAFSDWGTDGGRLTLTAKLGSITLNNTVESTESDLVVDAGTVYLADGANHRSRLSVVNGATFSLVGGATGATLRGLQLGDATSTGTLALDPDETVVVEDNAIAFNDPHLTFSATLGIGEHTVFRLTRQPSDELIERWELFGEAMIDSGLDATRYNVLRVEQTADGWDFKIVVRAERPELTGETTWTGPGATWDAASWGGAAPTELQRAKFEGADPKDIAVSGVVDAGAIRFTEGDYTLSGGTIRLSGNTSAAIESVKGENEIQSALRLGNVTTVGVGSDKLTLSGTIKGGGLVKDGAGTLDLVSGGNMLPFGVSLLGGVLNVFTPDALGAVGANTPATLATGLLRFVEQGGSTMMASELEATTAAPNALEVRTDVPVTMPLPLAKSGAIVKTGSAPLAFEVAAKQTLGLTNYGLDAAKNQVFSDGDALIVPGGGASPAQYGAITVTEGELALRGTAATAPELTLAASVIVGAPTPTAPCENPQPPKLVVDHVNLKPAVMDAGFSGGGDGSSWWSDVYVVVTNGGALNGALQATRSKTRGRSVHYYVEDGSTYGIGDVCLADSGTVTNYYTYVNSSFSAPQLTIHGSAVFALTNSTMHFNNGPMWSLQPYAYKDRAATRLDFTFSSGSVFKCDHVDYSGASTSTMSDAPIDLSFDDSEWVAYQKQDTTLPSHLSSVLVRVKTLGRGLILAPPASYTWSIEGAITGPGGLVKRGTGTVRFKPHRVCRVMQDDPATLCYEGVTDIEEGVLAVETNTVGTVGAKFHVGANGVLDLCEGDQKGLVISGSGTVKNGTLVRPSIAAEDGETPLLDFANGLDASGRCAIRFADVPAAALGAEVAVARYSGTLPAGMTFRVKGTAADGSALGGTVRVADGVIYATPEARGLTILVR